MKRFAKITLTFFAGLGITAVTGYWTLLHFDKPEKPDLSAAIRKGTIHVAGLERTYLYYLPENLAANPSLVFIFHGSRGSGEQMRILTAYEFDKLADKNNFIAVYPDGFKNHWNDCRKSAAYAANTKNIDDLGFVRAMIRSFISDFGVDPSQIFATGFSNGGHMVYRLALEMPEAFRAVAAVAANLPTDENCDCTPSGNPISVLIMNGTEDPINPFDGGQVTLFGFGNRGEVRSSRETASYFKGIAENHASLNRIPEIYLFSIPGGGHTIPHPWFKFPRILGKTNSEINGAEKIWEFFQRQGTKQDNGQLKRSVKTALNLR